MQAHEYKNIDLRIIPQGALDCPKGEKAEKFALVNAANATLVGKTGIAGAIQNQGGDGLMAELNRLKEAGGCDVTQNKITEAYDLKAKGFTHIIHAVGPDAREEKIGFVEARRGIHRCAPGTSFQDAMNATYANILNTAHAQGISDVACPIISGGNFQGNKSDEEIAQATILALRFADEHLPAGGGEKMQVSLCSFEKYLDFCENDPKSLYSLLHGANAVSTADLQQLKFAPGEKKCLVM